MIGIVDYGVGNISAFSNVYKRLNMPCKRLKSVEDFVDVDYLILPGVGAFDHAMQALNNSGMLACLSEHVLQKKCPVLGVCVGMQMMARSSDEGKLKGLGWIDAEVKQLVTADKNLPLPHMGWNTIEYDDSHPLFGGMEVVSDFYFLHSYHVQCSDPNIVLAKAQYGAEITAVIASGNIFAMQCHPEKSHHNGVSFLKNFGGL